MGQNFVAFSEYLNFTTAACGQKPFFIFGIHVDSNSYGFTDFDEYVNHNMDAISYISKYMIQYKHFKYVCK